MTPDDKEQLVLALKETGKTCMMCGDGANDVGALKQAQVRLPLRLALLRHGVLSSTCSVCTTARVGWVVVRRETRCGTSFDVAILPSAHPNRASRCRGVNRPAHPSKPAQVAGDGGTGCNSSVSKRNCSPITSLQSTCAL